MLGATALFAVASVASGAGNPGWNYVVPAEAQLEDTSNPTHVIGNGTPASCTGAAVVAAVAPGGVITFDCGPAPVAITLSQTAKVFNDTGPRIVLDGGGAIRVFDQYQDLPVHVTSSTFGGAVALGNVCSNGGGRSSIGVSYSVWNSLFTHNRAIGNGANPAQSGTPGGGSGGAIYFVSNDASGDLVIEDSILAANPSVGFETQGLPGIFLLGDANPAIANSVISVPEGGALAAAIAASATLAWLRRVQPV